MKEVILILNSRAGSATAADRKARIEALLQAEGIRCETWLAHGDELPDLARRAAQSRPDAVFVAGGDGTLSCVAAALASTGIPLGAIPLGTLNHFAKDLGIPLDIEAAIRSLARGNTRKVDLARVNGRAFINNSSIGLYPRMVRHRQVEMEHRGRRKWVGMVLGVFRVFKRFRLTRVRIHGADQSFRCDTPFVFVGNNAYSTGLISLGSRPRLDSAELSLYTPRSRGRSNGRWELFKLAVRSLLGKLEHFDDFAVVQGREFRVDSAKASLHVSIDGEITTLSPPLRYEIVPGALTVLVPDQEA